MFYSARVGGPTSMYQYTQKSKRDVTTADDVSIEYVPVSSPFKLEAETGVLRSPLSPPS